MATRSARARVASPVRFRSGADQVLKGDKFLDGKGQSERVAHAWESASIGESNMLTIFGLVDWGGALHLAEVAIYRSMVRQPSADDEGC